MKEFFYFQKNETDNNIYEKDMILAQYWMGLS
jgi:hypothetical protein